MNDADFDIECAKQQLAFRDTIAWDEIYARACQQARDSGHAQLILEHGSANYELINGGAPNALKLDRLHGAKVHMILDWEA